MNRRIFLSTGAGAILGCRDLAFLSRLAPVSAAEARVDPSIVRFDAAIEPLVRLLEQTPRERLFEEVAARITKGLTYKETLAALLLAGIRNVQPRPSVGFKFHAVLVVHSAHLVALASPEADRWLPIFWALDQFKRSQAADVRDGDWTMGAVDPKALPSTMPAARAFTTAMDEWDESRADAAAAALARGAGPWRSLRDFRALCRSRLPLDWPQGDLRGQRLAHARDDRLATQRAGAPIARLRAARPGGKRPAEGRRRRRSSVAPQSAACRPRAPGLGERPRRHGSDHRDAGGLARRQRRRDGRRCRRPAAAPNRSRLHLGRR